MRNLNKLVLEIEAILDQPRHEQTADLVELFKDLVKRSGNPVASREQKAPQQRRQIAQPEARIDEAKPGDGLPKLVRDRIPEIILRSGRTPVYGHVNKRDFAGWLYKKLREETREFMADPSPAELIDVLEVVYAIIDVYGIPIKQFEETRLVKATQAGAFSNQYVLYGYQIKGESS